MNDCASMNKYAQWRWRELSSCLVFGLAALTAGSIVLVEGVRQITDIEETQTRLGLTVVGFATAFELIVLARSASRHGITEAVVAGSYAYNMMMSLGVGAIVAPVSNPRQRAHPRPVAVDARPDGCRDRARRAPRPTRSTRRRRPVRRLPDLRVHRARVSRSEWDRFRCRSRPRWPCVDRLPELLATGPPPAGDDRSVPQFRDRDGGKEALTRQPDHMCIQFGASATA